MNRVIKLLTLIVLSLSVYFIYQQTKESNIKILSLGDGLSLGINSSGSKDYGYLNYYKDYLSSSNRQVSIINKYASKDSSIKELKEKISTTPELRRELMESHILFLTIGYNDLLYKLSMENQVRIPHFNKIIESIEKEYDELLEEIRKYYKNEIIVIGYYKTHNEDYYQNIGIRKLNMYLKNNKNIKYIDTYYLLTNKEEYFPNPNSYYPNSLGYKKIADKIIQETLAKS